MTITNWEGLEPHPTDDCVHWSEDDGVKKMLHLRELWNKSLKGDTSALEELLSEAHYCGMMDVLKEE